MTSRFLSNLLSGDNGAAELFLAGWHGDPVARPGDHLRAVRELELPPPLAELYELAAKWPQAIVQNQLLWPPHAVDDRILFYVENQGVYEWATDGADVWGREADSEPWIEEEPTLVGFVLELFVFEAIFAASHGASIAWLTSERLSVVLAPLLQLPHGTWRWPDFPTSFYAGDEALLAVAAPNRTSADPGDDFSVFIGARDDTALAYLDELVDDSWEYFSRRDSESP
jgi:hypothetical protein